MCKGDWVWHTQTYLSHNSDIFFHPEAIHPPNGNEIRSDCYEYGYLR